MYGGDLGPIFVEIEKIISDRPSAQKGINRNTCGRVL